MSDGAHTTRPPLPPADAERVRRILAGDEAAFAALVTELHPALVRLARGFVRSEAVAEECAQDTWMVVLEGLDRFEGRSSLRTWIFRILSNRAKTRAVRDGRTIPASALARDEGGDDPAVEPTCFDRRGMWADPPERWQARSAEAILERTQALERLEVALEELPPKQRAVVTLRDIEGLEAAEVCNVLDLEETHQRVLLHRARSHLRRVLADYLTGKGQC